MIEFIKQWSNQIIIAVIIATIFEMILPNGNNKKYIKMIIGLYVLFSIIQPIIVKVSGESLEISSFHYDKYFNEEILDVSTENFENNNSKLIEQAYIDNINEDIKSKIEKKGYEIISCDINIISDQKEKNYGEIESIYLEVDKIGKLKNSVNTTKIEEVNISVNNSEKGNTLKEKSNISDDEKIKLIDYLAEDYSIDRAAITIN